MTSIDEIKARLAATNAAKAEADRKRILAEQEIEARKIKAAEDWVAVNNAIQLITNEIDAELESSGLRVRCEHRYNDSAALAKFDISLSGSATGTLQFTVSGLGKATSRMSVPGLSRGGPSFEISVFSADQFKAQVLDFIGQAVPAPRK